MSNLFILDHPLIQHKITHIRDVNTGTKEFRELVDEVSMLMAFEITRDLPLKKVTVETPVIETESSVIAGKKIGLIPILRAGLGMVDGMLQLRSEEHTSELQSRGHLVCRLLLEKKKKHDMSLE